MEIHIQLEDRVADGGGTYRSSGNLLLDRVLGATLHAFPEGEDEAAADAAMERRAGSTPRWLVSSSMAMPGQAALNEASLGTSHFSATASTETMRTRRGVVRWRSETPWTSAARAKLWCRAAASKKRRLSRGSRGITNRGAGNRGIGGKSTNTS